MTKQRKLILEELESSKDHPSAYDVYEGVKGKLPSISLGTVYRNLEVLSEAGRINRIEIPGDKRRYEAEHDPHYHIRCIHCGKVDDLELDRSRRFYEGIAEKTGYRNVNHSIEFTGECPECVNNRRARELKASGS